MRFIFFNFLTFFGLGRGGSFKLGKVRWLTEAAKIEKNPRWLPRLSFAQISPLLWSFSNFWSSFIEKEVLNEEKYTILGILYSYSLRQHIVLVFCNNCDRHYRMIAYSYMFFSLFPITLTISFVNTIAPSCANS